MNDKEIKVNEYGRWISLKAYEKLEAENAELQKYKRFHDHIKSHFKKEHPDWEVMCKICHKTFKEIMLESGGSTAVHDGNQSPGDTLSHRDPTAEVGRYCPKNAGKAPDEGQGDDCRQSVGQDESVGSIRSSKPSPGKRGR